LAGVSALVFALVAFSLGTFMRQSTVSNSALGPQLLQGASVSMLPFERDLQAEVDRRMSVINARKVNWDPLIREGFERNLGKIDESLKACRQGLLVNPDDRDRRQMVLTLYQEKTQLLDDLERLK
jgi:hypothetical protein